MTLVLLLLPACTSLHLPTAARRAPLPLLRQSESQDWRAQAAAASRVVGAKVQAWPATAKEGATMAARSAPAILIGSYAASAAIAQLLPSRSLATFLVTISIPSAKVLAAVTMAMQSFMLPVNWVVSNVGDFIVALPLFTFALLMLLSRLPLKVAMRCVGASTYAEAKELQPALYQALAFVPKKLEAVAKALNLGSSAASTLPGMLHARVVIWFVGPLNEEVLFRGLVQGPAQSAINRWTPRSSEAQKRCTLALHLGVAICFGLLHAQNYLPLLQAISQVSNPTFDALTLKADRFKAGLPFLASFPGDVIPLRFKSVLLVAITQCLATAAASFFVFSPAFARGGLVASFAAHSTWNILTPLFIGCMQIPFGFSAKARHLLFEMAVMRSLLMGMLTKQ